jgi:hypothetical protein
MRVKPATLEDHRCVLKLNKKRDMYNCIICLNKMTIEEADKMNKEGKYRYLLSSGSSIDYSTLVETAENGGEK